jgi:hypothetical protein
MPTIEQALEQLKATAFPEFPEDDTLSDWVGELAEFDGYVAGLAMSAIGGGQVDLRRLGDQAKHFRSVFAQLPRSYPAPEDDEIYSACEQYLKLVEGVVDAMNEHKKA